MQRPHQICWWLPHQHDGNWSALCYEKTVREEKAMVARVALQDMKHDRDETIRSFCARIRGQARVSKFLFQYPNCRNDVDYSDSMIRNSLVWGIEDRDFQLELKSGDISWTSPAIHWIKIVWEALSNPSPSFLMCRSCSKFIQKEPKGINCRQKK